MSRTHRAAAGALTGYLQFFLQIVLQFALAPVVLAYAGKETLGAYAVVGQVVGYVALLDLGFSATFSRFLSHATGTEDGGRRFANVLVTGRTFLACAHAAMGLVCLAMAFLIGPMLGLSQEVKADAFWGLLAIGGWSLVRGPLLVASTALLAQQDIAFRNIITTLTITWRLVISLLAVWAGWGLLGLMLAQVTGEIIDIVCCNARFRSRTGRVGAGWGIPDRELFTQMRRFGGNTILINVAVRLAFFTDQIVIGAVLGAAACSVYYATQMPVLMGWQAVFRISDSSTPAVYQLTGMAAMDRLRSVFLRLHRYTFMISLPLCAGILVLNRPFVTLWVGAEQYGGALLNTSLAVFAVMICTSHISGMFVTASGEIKVLSRISLLEGILNVGLSVVLVHSLGLGGVMLAKALTHLVGGTYAQVKAQRWLGVGWREFAAQTFLRGFVVSLLSGLSLLGATELWPPTSWREFAVLAFSFVVLHGVLLLMVAVEHQDRVLARAFFGLLLRRSTR